MAKTPAKTKADAKWCKKAYDRINFIVRKDAEINADVIRRFADWKGVGVATVVKLALSEMVERDKEK